jgi:hypothetical protein
MPHDPRLTKADLARIEEARAASIARLGGPERAAELMDEVVGAPLHYDEWGFKIMPPSESDSETYLTGASEDEPCAEPTLDGDHRQPPNGILFIADPNLSAEQIVDELLAALDQRPSPRRDNGPV